MAKVAAKEIVIEGARWPVRLPEGDPGIAALLGELRAIEEMAAAGDPRQLPIAGQKRSELQARILRGEARWSPAAAYEVVRAIGFDDGHVPDEAIRRQETIAPAPAARKYAAALQRYAAARVARRGTWQVLFSIACQDPAIQARIAAGIDEVPAEHRSAVLWALAAQSTVDPSVEVLLRRVLETELDLARVASVAAGIWLRAPAEAFAALRPVIDGISDEPASIEKAKVVLDAAAARSVLGRAAWSDADPRWRALLEPLAARAAVTFDPASPRSRPLSQLANTLRPLLLQLGAASPPAPARAPAPPLQPTTPGTPAAKRDRRKAPRASKPKVPPLAKQRSALLAQLRAAGLEDRAPQLIRPAIVVGTKRVMDGSIERGATRVGGLPDLPRGTPWPDHGGTPLGFVAQVRLEELTSFEGAEVLPRAGLLSFFVLDQPRGDQIHGGAGRVFHFADTSTLVRVPPPRDEFFVYAECAVELFAALMLPHEQQAETPPWLTHLLGWRIHGGDETAPPGHQLLLQIGSDPQADMAWGAGGDLSFFINEDALRSGDFAQAYPLVV